MRCACVIAVVSAFALATPAHAQFPLGETYERLLGPLDGEDRVGPEAGGHRIMRGFVPDIGRLEQITGEEMRERYPGRTVKGIYLESFLTEQRFVEVFDSPITTAYREGDYNLAGRWTINGDIICFQYNEVGARRHCFHEFRYGDCTIVYPADLPIRNGAPVFPAAWNSVNVFAPDGFEWPDVPAEEAEPFACQLLTS